MSIELSWFEQFYAYLENEKRFSKHTTLAYQRDLRDFQQFYHKFELQSLRDVTVHTVRQYIADANRRQLGARSIQRRLSALRSFYRYLEREKYVDVNPVNGVKAPKIPQRLPKIMDVDQVQALLTITDDDALAVRDVAILELFYSSGLRLTELVSLNINDLDIAGKTLRVLGKGNKVRQIPVGKMALEALKKWFEIRECWISDNECAIFITRKGSRISQRNVQARLKQWGQKQSLNTGLHPHRLRHSFASHLLESSSDIRAVQELLGHENLSSTQIYTHLDFQHLANVYDKAHPRAKKKTR